jgi:hypothetical protein
VQHLQTKQTRKKIEKIRSRFEHVIIPVVEDLHFFVFVVDFSQAYPDFFINVHYYNSLQRSTRAGAQLPSDSSEIVAEVNEFLCNFVLHKPEHEHLQREYHEVFDKLQYQECPKQINGIDCGLFCVGVTLHILVGETTDRDTFSQEHITELRLKLGARHNRTNKTNHQPTSKVVRDCFPSLRGTTILSEHCVEDVTPLHIHDNVNTTANTIASTITITRSTTRALTHDITTAMTVTTAVLRAKMTTSVLMLIPFKRMDVMSKNRHLWDLSRKQLQIGRLWIPHHPHHPVCVTHLFKKS